MSTLNPKAQKFISDVRAAQQYDAQKSLAEREAEMFHVVGAGRTISLMYEQVRNAAENAEQHLLLQRAVRRFYARIFLTDQADQLTATGEELITELTLAGYVPDSSVSLETVRAISTLANRYYQAYRGLQGRGLDRQRSWVVDVLATEINMLLRGSRVRDIFEQFVFEHYRDTISASSVSNANDFEPLLFIAIHQALLKSDDAIVRWVLLRRYGRTPEQLDEYAATNEYVDTLLHSKELERLRRAVSREGAAFRVLASMTLEQDGALADIEQPTKFLPAYEDAVNAAYETAETRINRGVIRSIIFLIISKSIVGLAVEVPYDLLVHDKIIWMVLAVNLFIPPVYMLLLRLTLQLPGAANTTSLVTKMDKVLYGTEAPAVIPVRQSASYGAAFNIAYALLILAIFGVAIWGLMQIGFEVVHLAIFLIFFSTASFLGFRLSRMIRELEAVESRQNAVAMIRDFIYLPFVVVGRKISESYSKFNLMAMMLDMFIELPLKSVLRLVRQWGAFISSKKDEL